MDDIVEVLDILGYSSSDDAADCDCLVSISKKVLTTERCHREITSGAVRMIEGQTS